MKILIMGLPGAGKTTLANALAKVLEERKYSVYRLNADIVRTIYNDWDFSIEGRLRQAERIAVLANNRTEDFVIADFVAALEQQRTLFAPDFLVWLDTIIEGRYKDTNAAFERPIDCNYIVKEKACEFYSTEIANVLDFNSASSYMSFAA